LLQRHNSIPLVRLNHSSLPQASKSQFNCVRPSSLMPGPQRIVAVHDHFCPLWSLRRFAERCADASVYKEENGSCLLKSRCNAYTSGMSRGNSCRKWGHEAFDMRRQTEDF
jgi:hypothetical protein